jgi:hypothetical protein
MDLHPGEDVVFEGHPSWRALLAFYLERHRRRAADRRRSSRWSRAPRLGVVVGVVLIALVLVVGFVRRMATTYMVSNQRLYIRRGILAKREQQTRIDRVQNVNTDQSLVERILRVGTVDFDTAGTDDSDFTLRRAVHPEPRGRGGRPRPARGRAGPSREPASRPLSEWASVPAVSLPDEYGRSAVSGSRKWGPDRRHRGRHTGHLGPRVGASAAGSSGAGHPRRDRRRRVRQPCRGDSSLFRHASDTPPPAALGRRECATGRALSTTPSGARALARLNGLIGEPALCAKGYDLHVPMPSACAGRHGCPPTRRPWRRAFPAATPDASSSSSTA